MKFIHLILRKFIKFVATRCGILRANSPNSISAGDPPQTPLGAYSASPDPLAGFEGPTSKGGENGTGRGIEWVWRGKEEDAGDQLRGKKR